MKTYNIKTRISKQAKSELQRIINTHDAYKGSYFFNSATSSGTRRSNEKRFVRDNPDVCFITNKGTLTVTMTYSESCKNVYYNIYITLDNVSKNITAIKNLLK